MKPKNLISTIAAIIFISTFSVFAQTGGKVSGTVTYLGDKTPLHNVSVQIIQLRRSVATDDSGKFELSGIPVGRYTLLVHLEGFADISRTVDVTADSNLTENFELQLSSLRADVTVTASGTEQSVFDSFQTVNSVPSTRIAEKASTSLGEVLETETGVAKRAFGVGSSRPVIRGFDGDRVLVLQDGVRGGSVGSQSGDHGESVDPLSAERIEVVKGPATLLYGSNAIGGVVNVIGNDENQPHTGFRGFLNTVAGTSDRQAGIAGGLEYGWQKWLFRGNLSAQRTGDYRTPLGKVQNSATRANTQSFSAGYYANKFYLNGGYGYDVRRYGIPYAALFEAHEEEKQARGLADLPVLDDEIDLRQRRHNFRINGGFRSLENSFLSGLQYNLDYSDYRHKEIETADGIDEVGTIFNNKSFSYRTLFEQTKYKKLTGRFGFEGFNRDYEVNGAEQLVEGKIKQNSFSAFTLQELGFERVRFQFGGRIENNRYNPENTIYRDRNFTGFSAALGMNVGLWKGGSFIVNYSNSYRAPALEELYNEGPHIGNVTFEIGDQNLKRERANGLDVSLRHQSNKFRITGDVYYYDIKDFVYFAYQDEDNDGITDIEDGLPVARFSQSDAKYLGAELSADVTFTKYVGGFLSLDTVRAKLKNDENLPRIPPARARLGVDFRYKNFNLRPEAIFVRNQEKTAPLETRTAGYGIFNIAGSYIIGTDHFAHIFSVNAYNLTDKLYRNHLSFIKDLAPEIGRGVRFSYTVRFF